MIKNLLIFLSILSLVGTVVSFWITEDMLFALAGVVLSLIFLVLRIYWEFPKRY